LTALFSDEIAATQAGALLQVQDFFDGCTILGTGAVPDQDWVRLTQSQFAPVDITPTFWIVPTWHAPPVSAQTVIRLDPGLAFGTGTHPTTRMCLRWIANHPMPLRMLDYGCGSGILAIAAAKFGAAQVLAVDIDPAAVESTELNAMANQIHLTAGLPERAQGQYKLVLANILASPLKVLAPLLCAHVETGGHLVLAGILERQVEELVLAYAPHCTLSVSDSQEGWVLMTAVF
jgi:ribosomal protein L11 methyltransferase